MTSPCSLIEAGIAAIRDGRMIIVVDDAERENEGDLVVAASAATEEHINFMAKFGRGLICVPMPEERARRLDLDLMVNENTDPHRTAFTVSVDAAVGTTTGISVADRARTVTALCDPRTRPEDLRRPGHLFPLVARQGGVLRRAGHTEAAVDLASLAGREPVGVICEILNEDGTMARMADLERFAAQHGLMIVTIRDLIAHRRRTEELIEEVVDVDLPTRHGPFRLHAFNEKLTGDTHLALVAGEIDPDQPALVRVHSECLTGDLFHSFRCDCGDQLEAALALIQKAGGVLVYMRQEGRGIGLTNKLKAYALQEQGLDTVEANLHLGFSADLREYGVGAQILVRLGVRCIRLLTNNPRKIIGLEGYGLTVTERVAMPQFVREENRRYLAAKRDKLGHLLDMPETPAEKRGRR